MKINKVHRGSISGIEAYFIEYEGGGVFVQRAAPTSASDNPLSNTEEIICALSDVCEERDRFRKDSEAFTNLLSLFDVTDGYATAGFHTKNSLLHPEVRNRLEGKKT